MKNENNDYVNKITRKMVSSLSQIVEIQEYNLDDLDMFKCTGLCKAAKNVVKDGINTGVKIVVNFTNATLIGMKPYDNETNIKDTSVFRKDLVVTDVVYNPIKTKMILDAEKAGCKVVGGKGMLLYQGVEAFKLFMGQEMPVEEVKAKYYSDL